jgi:hypothetical protein
MPRIILAILLSFHKNFDGKTADRRILAGDEEVRPEKIARAQEEWLRGSEHFKTGLKSNGRRFSASTGGGNWRGLRL